MIRHLLVTLAASACALALGVLLMFAAAYLRIY